MRVKMPTKVGLSKGRGIYLDFLLKAGGLSSVFLPKKNCVSMHVLNFFQDLFISCLKVLVGMETKISLW